MKLSPWKKQVAENFSASISHYDAYASVQEQSAQKLMELCPAPKENMRILEIGCGTGKLTQKLFSKYPDADFFISDLSPDIIIYAKDHTRAPTREVRWGILDGEDLSNHNEKYDLIISNMVFQWFETPDQSLKAMRKNLKKGGQILFSAPSPSCFPEWQETLKSLNLQSGLQSFICQETPQESGSIKLTYQGAQDFLRQMKNIGAAKPKQGYAPISAANLRTACRQYDKTHKGHITWRIDYYLLGK